MSVIKDIDFKNILGNCVGYITFKGNHSKLTITLHHMTIDHDALKDASYHVRYDKSITINKYYNIFERIRDMYFFGSEGIKHYTTDNDKWFEYRLGAVIKYYTELAKQLVHECNIDIEIKSKDNAISDIKNRELEEFVTELTTGVKPFKVRHAECVKEVKKFEKVTTYEGLVGWIR